MRNRNDKRGITIFAIMAVLLIAVHYLLELRIFERWEEYIPFLKKLTLSLFLISLIFLVSKVVERVVNTQTRLEGDRYNLLRIIRFLAIVFSLIVAVSFLFKNLYAAALSVGLFSLVVGFALQSPITSFIAWIYLIFRFSGRPDSNQRSSWRCGRNQLFGYLNFRMQWRLFKK